MSILGNLKLAYETLADDPIEMGIYYGHSILSVLSERVSQPQRLAYATAAADYSYRPIAARPVVQRVAAVAPEPRAREVAPVTQPRRDYSRYISRSPVSRSPAMYTQRTMIGAL